MERKTRRLVTGLTATGVIAGALAGGGVLLADSAGAAPAYTAAAFGSSASTGSSASAGTAASTGTAVAGAPAPGFNGDRYLRIRGAGLVFRTSAAYLGVSRKQLAADLKAGKSLDAVAAARGKSASGLDSAITAAVTKRVDASKLTAARKAALTGFVNSHVAAFTAATHPFEWAKKQLADAS